jgi:hypothetical protein
VSASVERMFTSMSTSRVESELVEMAGHLAAGTCRFLQLLAEFDERDGWAGPGLRTCAQWLNWRVGLSLRTARDHLRVAHALRRLPLITAAFAAGRVSYSKVRAMTRIAAPATEEGLLSVALHGTTSQLEGVVAAARAATDPRPARARRGLWTSRAADGSLLVRLRVPAEQGEELMSAIDALVAQEVGCDGSAEPSGPEQAPGDVADPRAARRLDALSDLVGGARIERPATLVVHVRADEPGPVDERPAAWIDGGTAIPQPVAERLACAASVQALLVDRKGNPLFLGRERRVVTRRLLRALRVRDRGRCVFPGCTSTRRLQAHHVRWWRHGGTTDLHNLALVCGFHHALVHDHGFGMEAVEGGGFAFARPDGTRVPPAGGPTSGDVGSLVSPGVDDRTITPRWGGERLDRDHFLTWLLPARRREEERAAA